MATLDIDTQTTPLSVFESATAAVLELPCLTHGSSPRDNVTQPAPRSATEVTDETPDLEVELNADHARETIRDLRDLQAELENDPEY